MNQEKIKRKTEASILRQLKERGYATAIDCLIDVGWLPSKEVTAWEAGRVKRLEDACNTSLPHLSTFL